MAIKTDTSHARKEILDKLRAAPQPFMDAPEIDGELRRAMVPLSGTSPEALKGLFLEAARTLSCDIFEADSEAAALQYILKTLGDDKTALAWDFSQIPLSGLESALQNAGIQVADSGDASVRVGITGADAGLAATGTLVFLSGAHKPRRVSLLPEIHIAVLKQSQLIADLETWLSQQSPEQFRQASNIILISGPSRTADIEFTLVMGAHGPREVHMILLP